MERFGFMWFVSSIALAFASLILGSNMSIGDDSESTASQILTLALVGLVFTLVHEFIGAIV